MSSAIVLATTAENAEALLSGERDRDHRRFPPKKLPARAYLLKLRAILRTLAVSDADMEKGQLRCDVNVSACRRFRAPFGTWRFDLPTACRGSCPRGRGP